MSTLVGTRERERAADALRRHYLSGRLEIDEFGDRVRLALSARDGRDLRRAMRGLPATWRDTDEMRRVARVAKRRVVLATVKALWALVSLVLLVAFVTGDQTTATAVGSLVAWLLVSALAWRAARRA